MTHTVLSNEQMLLIAAVLVALYAASHLFNGYIDRQADKDPEGPGSGIYVVLGVGYTLVGAAAVLWIAYGFVAALWVVAITAGCFVASGIPMIFGGIRRTSNRRMLAREEAERKARQAAREG